MRDSVNVLKKTYSYALVTNRPAVSSGGSAPTVSAINYAQGDIAGGGQSIVVTGTNLSSVTSVTIFGASVSPSATSSTTCTFTLPAHASGTGTVSVTSPGGTSGTLAFEYWSPIQVTGVTRFFDSSLGVTSAVGAVSQWVDAKNGAAFTQATGANKPALTANAFGTLPGLQFTPEQFLNQATSADGESAMSPFSLFAVAKTVSGRTARTSIPYDSPQTILGGGGWSGFGLSGGGVSLAEYDVALQTFGSGLANGAPHVFGITSDATPTVRGYIDGAASGSPSALGGNALYYWDHIGDGYSNTDGFNGTLGALLTCASTVISGGDLTKLNAWAQQRFGTP